uniref:Putative secreted protein n=1 Tax=Panstrongylus lignarius TaxID=156445 RepID=A0A224Y0U4_9HEMI
MILYVLLSTLIVYCFLHTYMTYCQYVLACVFLNDSLLYHQNCTQSLFAIENDFSLVYTAICCFKFMNCTLL